MPRPRKPDALTNSERQRRYRAAHDLGTLKLPRPVLQRLDAVAGERGLGRAAAFVLILDEWEAGRRRGRDGSVKGSPGAKVLAGRARPPSQSA